MNFEEFAEMNEEFLSKTPTQMLKIIDEADWRGCEKLALKIWGKTYPNNGVGEAGLLKRVAEFWDIEEYTLETMSETLGGLSEAIFDWSSNTPQEITHLEEVEMCLYAECRDEAYEHFFTLFPNLSPLGRKWLTAFILKETRNGKVNW